MEVKTYEMIYEYLKSIETDCKYMVRLSLRHLFNVNNGFSTRKSWRTALLDNRQHSMGGYIHYEYSELVAYYFNKMGTYVKYKENFKFSEPIVKEEWRELNRMVAHILDDKKVTSKIIGVNQYYDNSEVLYRLGKLSAGCTFKEAVNKIKDSAVRWTDDQSKAINDYTAIVDVDGIRLRKFKYDDNEMNDKNIFDYIRVYVPIFKRGCDYKQTIEYIKMFKKDIDSIVLQKMKSKLKSSNVSLSYFKLSNLTFRQDYILEYTFSFKELT